MSETNVADQEVAAQPVADGQGEAAPDTVTNGQAGGQAEVKKADEPGGVDNVGAYKVRRMAPDEILLDSSLQHRDDAKGHDGLANPERAALYKELMDQGVEFPPPRVMATGKENVLFGGFHTLAAKVAQGKKLVEVKVYEGGWNDVLWASLGENIGPAQRTEKTLQNVAWALLESKKFKTRSDRSVAKHMGIPPSTFRRYKEKYLADQAARAAKGEAPPPEEKPDEVEYTRAGKPARQKVKKKRAGKGGKAAAKGAGGEGGAKAQDGLGNAVPEHLAEAFESGALLGSAEALAMVQHDLAEARKARLAFFLKDDVFEMLRRAEDLVRAAVPFAVCPACQGTCKVAGKACVPCGRNGYLSEAAYEDYTKASGGRRKRQHEEEGE
jgi:hypothetical protein